jgi:hypothetical protein
LERSIRPIEVTVPRSDSLISRTIGGRAPLCAGWPRKAAILASNLPPTPPIEYLPGARIERESPLEPERH